MSTYCPKDGELFYCVDIDLIIITKEWWDNEEYYENLLRFGNCFPYSDEGFYQATLLVKHLKEAYDKFRETQK